MPMACTQAPARRRPAATHYCDRHRPHQARPADCGRVHCVRFPESRAGIQRARSAANPEHPTGRTVMTTIQKFQEITDTDQRGAVHPTLSEATNIFVMVDEAHRTQYRSLAANMRQALPNACFLGFTGTPIDKKDRSTLRTFGPYIDTYTIEQAVQDGATVPILLRESAPRAADHRTDHRSGIRSCLRRLHRGRTDRYQAAVCHRAGDCQCAAPHRDDLPGPD